ncbi:C40 family peptidase [Halomonas salifodinae]|uniref:C40 family peptidase n=1 Tax=Halomonas salifodinae TaxID=438745 RepID=A0ABW2F0W4_9GAMM
MSRRTWPRGLRMAGAGLLLAVLAGCASAPRERSGSEEVAYFDRSLPSLADGALMSPAERGAYLGFSNPALARVRQALLDAHERWVGTPYRLGGSSPRGIDCSALVQRVFQDNFRIELPRTTDAQVHEGTPVARDELLVGDLVFFRPPGAYNHVGIYVGEGYFLHASTSQGVILSELDNVYWRRHYWQARRPMEPEQLAQRTTWFDS